MKTIARLFISVFFVVLLIGCNDEKKQLETLLKTSQRVTDSLNAVIQEENAKREILARELDELDTYTKGLGVTLSAEKDPEKQQTTIERIKEAANTLKSQKEKIAQLTAKVARLEKKLEEVSAENERLKGQIAKLAGENRALRNQVDSLNRVTASLKSRLAEAVAAANTQREKLNTGFYIMGGTGFLRDNGVLERRGPFGNAYNPNFNPLQSRNVRRIDISQTTEIEVPAQKSDVVLWSPHMRSSYEVVEKSGDRNKSVLRILNPDEFWQTAKVLAIGTEG
ncbi:MAG: Cbp1 family collagen-binding glycoprotein adhesin [Chlorobiales bacterium]